MGTGQLEVVADAGPLIHLAEIKQITLLEIFDAIHIPDAVWQETVGQKRISVYEASTLFVTRAIIDLALQQLR
ncbi:MAG: hypothetical protein KDE53_16560 [Caldilineaceae bacterium]|nr:hypothetical protein [Caldilineaceae bacterium]